MSQGLNKMEISKAKSGKRIHNMFLIRILVKKIKIFHWTEVSVNVHVTSYGPVSCEIKLSQVKEIGLHWRKDCLFKFCKFKMFAIQSIAHWHPIKTPCTLQAD